MTHEEIGSVLKQRSIPFVHYHISEPMLANAATGVVDHETAFRTLKEIGYQGTLSIEMKMQTPQLENLESALKKITGAINAAEI